MSRELGIGIVGFGWMEQLYSRTYRRLHDRILDCHVIPQLVIAGEEVEDLGLGEYRETRLRGMDHGPAEGCRTPESPLRRGRRGGTKTLLDGDKVVTWHHKLEDANLRVLGDWEAISADVTVLSRSSAARKEPDNE